MEILWQFRDLLGRLTEGLANLTFKGVLLGIGVLLLMLVLLRLTTSRRNRGAAWMIENLQVVAAVVIVVFLVIRPFLFQAFYIPSSSMEPTLLGPPQTGPGAGMETTGDRLLVNKLLYKLGDPARFDIVVFRAPPQASPDEKEYIKRVIGLPGETLEVVPPRLLLDGVPLMTLIPSEGGGISIPAGEKPRVEDEGRRAVVKLSMDSDPLEVIATPDPVVRAGRDGVQVNGRRVLEVPASWLMEIEGFAAYGGDPRIEGRLFTRNDRPRLAVVRGRKLEYDPGHVLVNGRRIDEPYIADEPRYAMAPRRLGEDEYLVLGDNRNFSQDSHLWGNLKRERIIGRAEVLFWPLSRLHIFHWWLLAALGALVVGYQLVQRLLGGPVRE